MSIIEKFVNKLKEDGKDHVRISRHGDTTLGRICSHDYRRLFYVPNMGSFINPICFANWITTGDEDAREDLNMRTRMPLQHFQLFVLYSKYFQLASFHQTLVKEYKGLPMVGYKEYQTGIREMDRWKDYSSHVKQMVEHLIECGPEVPYPWEIHFPGITKLINDHLFNITGVDPTAPRPPKKKKQAKNKPEGQSQYEGLPVDSEEEDEDNLADGQPSVPETQGQPDIHEQSTAVAELQNQPV